MTEWALWQRKGTFLSVLSYTLSNSAHSTDQLWLFSFTYFVFFPASFLHVKKISTIL